MCVFLDNQMSIVDFDTLGFWVVQGQPGRGGQACLTASSVAAQLGRSAHDMPGGCLQDAGRADLRGAEAAMAILERLCGKRAHQDAQ